jgi:hypothetical protein
MSFQCRHTGPISQIPDPYAIEFSLAAAGHHRLINHSQAANDVAVPWNLPRFTIELVIYEGVKPEAPGLVSRDGVAV